MLYLLICCYIFLSAYCIAVLVLCMAAACILLGFWLTWLEEKMDLSLLNLGLCLYSPRFEGEQYTEFEKFLLTYKDTYPQDILFLVLRINIIKQNGEEPSYIDSTSLRLNCRSIEHTMLILGNGDLKTAQMSQGDSTQPKAIQAWQKIDIDIKHQQDFNVVTVQGTNFKGPLVFTI